MTAVHIITVDHDTDGILGRQVRPLVRELGWTYSRKPDPRADVNYFFPYLQLGPGPDTGRTMAFFTHKDYGRPEKVAVWSCADARVDMRTTCARKYWRVLGSPKAIVVPDVQLNKFVPPTPRMAAPVVGTSGFVYPAGRKGEALFGELIRHRSMRYVEFTASGRGWPCECRLWPWDRLQEFYWGLAVYVCTSSIEGTGHGPLEALACGVPVVVPMDVGVFDELDGPGIHRYEAGDLEQLVIATEAALLDGTPADDLRQSVVRFTGAAWLASNKAAVAALMAGKP